MKLIRFLKDNQVLSGVLEKDSVKEIEGSFFDSFKVKPQAYPLSAVKLLAPVLPSKIICLGLNYADHAKEVNKPLPAEPMLFMKPSTAVINPGDNIVYPPMTQNLHYEAELAVVIKKKAKDVPLGQAFDYILGYTCLNDVTARDLQAKDVQFTRAKSFDTFAPMGPCIETSLDPSDLKVESCLNGNLCQSSSTKNLIFNVPFLVSFISQVMTLLPGDAIATGTPSGVGPMKPGDKIEVRIEGIGTLINQVAAK
jgi:2-keto-4-pentenoate hydratase/2-oxohepta-3-ene-1,7-dioic acid hydratase in catechol pathway